MQLTRTHHNVYISVRDIWDDGVQMVAMGLFVVAMGLVVVAMATPIGGPSEVPALDPMG